MIYIDTEEKLFVIEKEVNNEVMKDIFVIHDSRNELILKKEYTDLKEAVKDAEEYAKLMKYPVAKYKIWCNQRGQYFAENSTFESLNEIREQLISYHSADCNEESLKKLPLAELLEGFEWEVHTLDEKQIVIVKGNEIDHLEDN